jgi:exosortase family protein XrtF
MRFSVLKNPLYKFLLSILSLYILWYILYDLWLHPDERIDMFVIDMTISVSKKILEFFGYTVFTGVERVIGVDGTGGLWIGDNCNGMRLFALFACFIIAYKGRFIKKIIYIFLGILFIEFLNIMRVVLLAILDTHSRSWTEFNHTYTFTIIIYGFIFLLWMLWVNKFSSDQLKKDNP